MLKVEKMPGTEHSNLKGKENERGGKDKPDAWWLGAKWRLPWILHQ